LPFLAEGITSDEEGKAFFWLEEIMELSAKDLRNKLNEFQGVLGDIETFLILEEKLNYKIKRLIQGIGDDCDELFRLIPIGFKGKPRKKKGG